MSLDPNGLRRRSPNPNSPIPYSPALLSPYISASDNWTPAYGRQRYNSEALTPTIRLVQPSEAGSSSYAALPPLRTRSDDQHVRASTIASSVSTLRRHDTDPKAYPSHGRYRQNDSLGVFPELREKPVPPLPLNIRRDSSRPSPPASIHSHASSRISSSESRRGGNDTPRSSYSARSVVSSLKSLQNPFRRKSQPSSPALSARSRSTTKSFTSSSSRSSSATLTMPFDASSWWKAYSGDPGSMSMEKLRDSGVSEKVTSKFPARRVGQGKKEKWTGFKFVLLFSVLGVREGYGADACMDYEIDRQLLGYGLAGLTWALSILLRIRRNSDVTMVSDPDVVIFLTLASLLCIFSAMVGLTGVLLNSRPILAFYNLLLWPTLLSMCFVGYTSYKRGDRQLDRKLNQTWSQFLDDEQRLRIQNSLRCCGYFNPMHDATYSKRCYPRTELPGCKGRWTLFEQGALHDFATAAFATIPFHLLVIVTALLCSNHVDVTFGTGLTPAHYRLSVSDVRTNALAVLAALPAPSNSRPPSALHRQSAISYKSKRRSDSYESMSNLGSTDTLTRTLDMKRTRSRQGWMGEVMSEAGPKGRALREARHRGLL